jgi:hypothetical protein
MGQRHHQHSVPLLVSIHVQRYSATPWNFYNEAAFHMFCSLQKEFNIFSALDNKCLLALLHGGFSLAERCRLDSLLVAL